LVEDQEDDVFFLKRAFQGVGIHNPVQVVQDGKDAMDYLAGAGHYADRERFPLPCLVLLDLKLPRVMGLEVLKWIRSQAELKTVIVLVLTSSRAPADIARAYQLGVDALLIKPSGPEELQEIAAGIKAFWLQANTGSGRQDQMAKSSDSEDKRDLPKAFILVDRS